MSDIPKESLFFGPNALKYDLAAVSFKFLTPIKIWRARKGRWTWCTKACFNAVKAADPEILWLGECSNAVTVTTSYVNGEWAGAVQSRCPITKLNPNELMPSLGDAVIRDWARRQG